MANWLYVRIYIGYIYIYASYQPIISITYMLVCARYVLLFLYCNQAQKNFIESLVG